MVKLVRGRYLSLLTKALAAEISALTHPLAAEKSPLHAAEVADRLSLHLSKIIERGLSSIRDEERVTQGLELASDLIEEIAKRTLSSLQDENVVHPGEMLAAVTMALPGGEQEEIQAPTVPLLDTALMTNSPGEPRIGTQIVTEIPSADRIDVIMAFIRTSGLAQIEQALRRHCEAGRELRVLTTTYTGSTELSALLKLQSLGAKIKISYDETSSRLHAKAWLFHRESGYPTAYVGSSNLTYSAQGPGLEWNVRVSGVRNPHVVDKVSAVFDSYWSSGDFVGFSDGQFREMTARIDRGGSRPVLPPVELRLEPFQERLLEQVALAREQGQHRNLIVSATGTGKTVMAAVDYGRLRDELPRARLLFVAHRKEILEQARATFRYALRDASFGELWLAGERPRDYSHVFASIQSLSRARFSDFPPDHFDIVIIDEFHHAEASSYKSLLEYLRPVELLGLTATPERADGLDLLHWFNGKIAAELRLWDAIDQHSLVPFAYYGIADNLDYRGVVWRRGRGYDVEGVSNLITADDAWARKVIRALIDKVGDVASIRALGFCVSVSHARFMARIFNAQGIASVAVWGDTPADVREKALADLTSRAVNVVFSVDIFNEGVDVPQVDTLMMLRPTDSATLFLQQLGRGLRRHRQKSLCTVIDFVGLHRAEFRFDRRLRALIGGTRKHLESQIEAGFPLLPAGCHMEFDRVSQQRILENIRYAIPSTWPRKIQELKVLIAAGGPVTLSGYLDAAGLELEDVYAGGRCWTDLVEDSRGIARPEGKESISIRKAISRLLHIDDRVRLVRYLEFVRAASPPDLTSLHERDRRLFRMLVSSLVGSFVGPRDSLEVAAAILWGHQDVLRELGELFELLLLKITHLGRPLPDRPRVPLTVHACYSRVEIQAAFGDGEFAKTPAWREGVRFMQAEQSDVFVVTFDKTGERFSPTTRYRDYAISRSLIHWESQSRTKPSDPTGTRYQNHEKLGSAVMIFARLDDDERGFYFLGQARYVGHKSEMPMQITWKLDNELPGDLFAKFAAAVA